jgi:hypothetical protein
MVTLHTIEPRNEAHGALIVEAFNKLFINRGGQSDGWGTGYGHGDGSGWGNGYGDGSGNGGFGGSLPEEWRVE